MLLHFNLFGFQQRVFMDGDDPNGGGGGDPKNNQQIKMVEKIDPVSNQKVKIPEDLNAYIGHIISHTRKETESQYKPMLEALENEKADFTAVKAELDKLKEASMTAEERAQANAKKVIEEHEKKRVNAENELKKYKDLFTRTRIENDVLNSFGDVKLCNSQQVAILFQSEGNARVEEIVNSEGKPTNTYHTKVTLMLEDDKGEPIEVDGTPSELFRKWIKLDRNAHHVRDEVGGGGGTRNNQNGRGGRVDLSKLPPKERIDAARQAQK